MQENSGIELGELLELVRESVEYGFGGPVWVVGEIGQLSENQKGHCYLELVEKSNDEISARTKATIWSRTYKAIKEQFEALTGKSLDKGMKILFCCTVEFHEVYGFSLNIKSIDPNYTLGEVERNRQEILRAISENGLEDLNKQWVLPELTNRLAVITSPTAAGYEDFINQLAHNEFGFKFSLELFPSIMQGEACPGSVMNALTLVANKLSEFDAVVIIRGGGSQLDLSSFDDFDLACQIAEFQLPVVVGIGHERDHNILDMIAAYSLKTPTAVAEFLISRIMVLDGEINGIANRLMELVILKGKESTSHLNILEQRLELKARGMIEAGEQHVSTLTDKLKIGYHFSVQREDKRMKNLTLDLKSVTKYRLQTERFQLENKELYINSANPDSILKKGFGYAMLKDQLIRSVKEVKSGDDLGLTMHDGIIKVKVR